MFVVPLCKRYAGRLGAYENGLGVSVCGVRAAGVGDWVRGQGLLDDGEGESPVFGA